MVTTATELVSETIRCAHCHREASCLMLTNSKEWYKNLPQGWLVTDTYPPGDMGLMFACSEDCAREL